MQVLNPVMQSMIMRLLQVAACMMMSSSNSIKLTCMSPLPIPVHPVASCMLSTKC